jgi:hypothetical protein
MFKMVTRILGVIALTGWMGAANATLIFDFSWDSDNGKIIGSIYGLAEDGLNLSATGIVLSSVGGMQVDIDVINDPSWTVYYNFFDVAAGEILAFDFYSADNIPGNIGTYSVFDLYSYTGYVSYNDSLVEYFNDSAFTFDNRVTVPEPSSVILMSLGLAGLSFARYRKQY